MPHELATTNNRTAMMYVGEIPWHGLGTRLNEPATAREAIEAAGLNYQADLKDIETTAGIPIPQRKAVVRSDTGDVLGVVGTSYVPVQNHQAFGFLDDVVADGSLRYHTAGALGKGERIWMLAKLPSDIRVKNSDDITEKFLLLSNSHDGTSSLRAYFTPVRVVCANTLAMAERGSRGQGVSIIHKGNLTAKVQQARHILGLATEFYDFVEAKIDRLARHYPNGDEIAAYFRALSPDPIDGDTSRAANIRHELHRLFEQGIGQDIPEIRHSSWAAYNALTEFVDRHRSTRGKTPAERANNRLESSWFGSGAKLKERAWALALQMAG